MKCESPALLNETIGRDHPDLPMVKVPPGAFIMGETAGDKFANDTERPRHRVAISHEFALGVFPVTAGQFREFRPGHSPEDADDLPAVYVSWQDAVDFCRWLAEATGRHYRLPSEAEWEYACRAGAATPFASGGDITTHSANFLYAESGQRIGVGSRTPGGVFPPNRFGFHDMHGNVCEWVADAWHANYDGAPGDGSTWSGQHDDRRVIRGGAWDYLPRLLRSSWRDWRPMHHRADNIGFRVAMTEPENS